MRLLVTDTTWNIAGLSHALLKQGFYVTEAANAEETLEYASTAEQDAVLIDPDLPDMSAAQLVSKLRMAHPKLVICIVSRRDTQAIRAEFLTRGADDVIEWPNKAPEIASRLRAYVRRAAGFCMPVIQSGLLQLDLSAMTLHYGDMPIHLTRVEYEMIEMLMLRNGAIVTRDQIMMQLYAWQDEPDPKIIDVYTCRIRAKLAAIGAPDDVIVTSFGQGIRIPIYSAPRDTKTAAA
ncbi:response regulator transcription factor [Pseudooceanicola sp. HF7]|uniref:response regulator transcription factor n=1 Tax=Pseudooceanicola sp. HF7 TaxID=2721560 RepID=UPI00142F9CDE|nr:response regulator transcription factor [Pseudooceanicola sp. HF7]NIZ10895.1 response regulator transcription factor [Pseudooceanicola sp. HF7]